MRLNTTWLSDENPLVAYRAGMDLSGQQDGALYEGMISYPPIAALLKDIEEWPGRIMKRHNDAQLLLHKLVFLAEAGVRSDHPVIARAVDKILRSASPEGPFLIMGNVPTVFGGSGKDEWMWMMCDAPLLVYALLKLRVGDERIPKAAQYLLSLSKEFGYPCAAAQSLGTKFRGPGRKTDPCPYANLLMLRMISLLPDREDDPGAKTAIDMLLDLWQHRREKKYFLFGMGTDFGKLKAPFIWFDILHVAEVLSHYPAVRQDRRFQEILERIKEQEDGRGRYTAGSVYRAWKDWDFGQKKEPSPWISFLVYRMLHRISDDIN